MPVKSPLALNLILNIGVKGLPLINLLVKTGVLSPNLLQLYTLLVIKPQKAPKFYPPVTWSQRWVYPHKNLCLRFAKHATISEEKTTKIVKNLEKKI